MKDDKGESVVTEKAPKPMQEILSKDGICLCAKCGYLGTGSEFTVSNYPADDYSSCCPKCDNSDEDRLISAESISDALCRPQQSAEPVAYGISLDGKLVDVYLHKGSAEGEIRIRNEVDAPGPPLGHRALVSLFAASPGPSELVEEMEKLEAELRDTAKDTAIHTMVRDQLIICADRLSALITRHRGKS